MLEKSYIKTGSAFEKAIGYSRAVVIGNWVFVSGTTGFNYDNMVISEDVKQQTDQCLTNLENCLKQAGSSLDDVVRVRYYLSDRSYLEQCTEQLCTAFAKATPAATMIVAQLVDPRMKIEVEVTAVKNEAEGLNKNEDEVFFNPLPL